MAIKFFAFFSDNQYFRMFLVSMPLLCEPNDAVRAVAVAKRREYTPQAPTHQPTNPDRCQRHLSKTNSHLNASNQNNQSTQTGVKKIQRPQTDANKTFFLEFGRCRTEARSLHEHKQ